MSHLKEKLIDKKIQLKVNDEEYPLIDISIDRPLPLKEGILAFDLDDHFNAHAELLLNATDLVINVAKFAVKVFFMHICFLLDPYNVGSDALDNIKLILRGVFDTVMAAISVVIRTVYLPVAMLCVLPRAIMDCFRALRASKANRHVAYLAINQFTENSIQRIVHNYQTTLWRKHPYALGISTFGLVAPQSKASRDLINLLTNSHITLDEKREEILDYMSDPANQGRALWDIIRDCAEGTGIMRQTLPGAALRESLSTGDESEKQKKLQTSVIAGREDQVEIESHADTEYSPSPLPAM